MANEISISCSLSASKGGASVNSVGSSGGATKQFDMTGADMGSGTQAFGTSDSQLVIPVSVTSVKYLLLKNLDATNYAELSYATGGSFVARVQIDPGGFALFRPTSTTIYIRGNVASVNVFWTVVEV